MVRLLATSLQSAGPFKMAPRMLPSNVYSRLPDPKYQYLYERFVFLNSSYVKAGYKSEKLLSYAKKGYHEESSDWLTHNSYKVLASIIVLITAACLLPYFDGILKAAYGVKCVIPNNYVVWEATRPITNCSMCSEINDVIYLNNVTREGFKKYAYTYRPIVVRNAVKNWPAVEKFDYDFFRELFLSLDGAHESVEEECQFLNFKTDFLSLREAFDMPRDRVMNKPGTKPWYIGWSNCHPQVLKKMRSYYSKPDFLPEDAEHSHVDFVFMGYQKGAFMHLDYISRLLWQAQLRGHKIWRLNPSPECEHICKSYSFFVNPGDIVLLDTRQWYHETCIPDGEFSLTVSSEYG